MARIVAIVVILGTMVLKAESTIYEVEPYQNFNDSAKYVRQTFVATTDSICSLWFFVGRSPATDQYILRILDGGAEIGRVTVDAPDKGWCWIGDTLAQPVAVTKGKTYTLEVKHEQSPNVYTNFYYRPNDEGGYPHGQLTNPNMPQYDLCARVWGRNDTSGGYFGFSGLFGSSGLFGLSSSSGLI